jgi:hypothetical protein
MRFLDAIENAVLWLADQDWAWWPVLRFRPDRAEPITDRLIIVMSSMVGCGVALIDLGVRFSTSDLTRHSAGVLVIYSLAIGVLALLAWMAVLSVAADCWNRRALRLTGRPVEARPPREQRPEQLIEQQLRGLVILATVGFYLLSYWWVAQDFEGPVPADWGQGVGLFWGLLLVVVLGLAPIMRWSIMVVAKYRPPWSAAYKAAYAGFILSFDIFVVAAIAFPEIDKAPVGSIPAVAVGSLLVGAVAAHSSAAALLRAPDSRRVGIASGTAIAVTYLACAGLGAGLLWAITHLGAVLRFLYSMLS